MAQVAQLCECFCGEWRWFSWWFRNSAPSCFGEHPLFHPTKKTRWTPKNHHSSSKILSSKPISFKGPRLLVFGFFFFRGFLNHRRDDDFPPVEVRLLVDGPAVDEDISHWRGLIHPKLAWVFWQELHSKKPTSKQETPCYVHPLDVFWKVTSLKRKTIFFQSSFFRSFCYYIHHLPTVKCVFFHDIKNPLEKKTNHPRQKSHRFFRTADDSSSCVEPADWLRCVAWVENKTWYTAEKVTAGT